MIYSRQKKEGKKANDLPVLQVGDTIFLFLKLWGIRNEGSLAENYAGRPGMGWTRPHGTFLFEI